jgi:hypothetical protein
LITQINYKITLYPEGSKTKKRVLFLSPGGANVPSLSRNLGFLEETNEAKNFRPLRNGQRHRPHSEEFLLFHRIAWIAIRRALALLMRKSFSKAAETVRLLKPSRQLSRSRFRSPVFLKINNNRINSIKTING